MIDDAGDIGASATDEDFYTIDLTGKAGQPIDIVLVGHEGIDFSGETLELLDTNGTTVDGGPLTAGQEYNWDPERPLVFGNAVELVEAGVVTISDIHETTDAGSGPPSFADNEDAGEHAR